MSTTTAPVALVTGGASGIGLAGVDRLVARGFHVAVLDLSAEALAAVADRYDGSVTTYPVDVSDADAIAAVVDKVEAEHGPVEHVFASAGIARVGPTLSVVRADVDLMMRVNYGGIVNVAYAVLPRMVERNRGEFAVVASLTGIVPPRKMAAYGATKAAVIQFLESLRYDLVGSAVKVTCVCPEAVRTPMAEDFFADPGNRAKADRTSITPEQVVAATEKGLAKGTFLVLPGTASRIFFRAQRFLPRLTRSVQTNDRFDFV